MKLFVTGGLGFIGSNFIHRRKEQGYGDSIINYDIETYAASHKNLAGLFHSDTSYQWVKGDIRNYNDVYKAMSGCDAVIHFAAESHVDNSIKGSSIFVDTNVMGTQVLLEAAKNRNIGRFIHVSTDEVYGDIKEGESKESDPTLPNNPYSASKLGAEALVRSYNRTHGLKTIITRCTNNFGPHQHKEKFVPLIISRALANKTIPIYGTGSQEREWIYVTDHCDGISAALKYGRVGEIYNFGSRIRLSNIEICLRILKFLGKPASLIRHVEDRLGHDLRYALDCTKAYRELGFNSQVSFEDGLENMMAWYKPKGEKK